MAWFTKKVMVSAEDVFEILNRHKLLPIDEVHAAAICRAEADCDHYEIMDDDEKVADVFVGPVLDGDSAELDLIIKTSRFRGDWEDFFPGAMSEIVGPLFAERRLRRITAHVPYSRNRTKRALCSIGFKHEGRMRNGVHLYGQDKPEDLRVLGLLREEYDGN